MIHGSLFSQHTYIDIQGPHVLDYLDQTDHFVHYQVVGLQSPKILIRDYRHEVKEALGELIKSGNSSQFVKIFSQPVFATLYQQASGELLLELTHSPVHLPRFMIWIVVGIEEEFPISSYDFFQVEALDERSYAGIAIYSLTSEESLAFAAFSSLDSVTSYDITSSPR